MYFHRRKMEKDPFSTFDAKRSVYHDFFKQGLAEGFDMYIASGKTDATGPLVFNNAYRYNGIFFEPETESIEADAVFDRSGGMSFPTEDAGSKTLNNIHFKRLCNNKNATQEFIGDFMPKSSQIKDRAGLLRQLESFSPSALVVLKPANGMCGNGIVIDRAEKIKQADIPEGREYILQEFVDTSRGIPGIIDGHHDLRIVIADGKIVLSHVRAPKEGSLLANVAQGGSIKEVPLENIPAFIIDRVKKIQERIDEKFNRPVYSIDLGVQNGAEPFVFELNDQIGFPSEKMKNSAVFIKSVLQSLGRLADV